jgi:hygromycin-B 4-O-kinase
MKTSNQKPAFSHDVVREYTAEAQGAIAESVTQLSEGHNSQAFSFETNEGKKLVLRIGKYEQDFVMDRYAHDHFNKDALPIPAVLDIGPFRDGTFYCVSEFVEGTPSDQLNAKKFADALSSIHNAFATLFNQDISGTHGYGRIDSATGNAEGADWQQMLSNEIEGIDLDELKASADSIQLDPTIIDRFVRQFHQNIGFSKPVRRLVHGDLGSDNLLIKDNKVVALIDWEKVGYGDWAYDFAWLDFWYPGGYGNAMTFAQAYHLDTADLEKRIHAYWARMALGTLHWAVRNKSESTQDWLRVHVVEKLIPV